MNIVLSLCCMTLAMLLHPSVLKNESESAFRTINIRQTSHGYSYFDSMAITSAEDFKAFLEEMSKRGATNHPQGFIDTLLKAQIDFNKEALVFLRHDEGTSGVRVTFETPVLQEKTLLCEIRGETPGMAPQVMANYCFAFAVSKSLVDKVQLKAPPPQPSPGECPNLIISCPTDLLETGKTYEVKVLVDGGNDPKYDGNYNWSVTGGEIVGGQGTRGLAVRIKEPNKILEAWVSLGGINPHCNAVATCSCGPSR